MQGEGFVPEVEQPEMKHPFGKNRTSPVRGLERWEMSLSRADLLTRACCSRKCPISVGLGAGSRCPFQTTV